MKMPTLSSLLGLLAALSTTALAEPPEGYRTVLITSSVDTKFVIVAKERVAGSTTIVKTRNDSATAEQSWYLKDGETKIQLAGTTLCMDGGPQANWRDMGAIYLQECDDDAVSQKWFVMDDGRIALEASQRKQCVDLVFMRAVENNDVGLFSCAGLGNIGAADKGINWPLVDVEVDEQEEP